MNNRTVPSLLLNMEEESQWYAMRFLYNDQPKIRRRLDLAGIETYSPMRTVVEERNGRKIRRTEPIIFDLIFVHGTRSQIDPYVRSSPNFQYRYMRGGKYREPMIVPSDQMRVFMEAVRQTDHPIYFTPDEIDVSRGTRIRIIGGPLDGYEGIFMKVKGARSRRLVVELPDTIAVAVEIMPDFIEVL